MGWQADLFTFDWQRAPRRSAPVWRLRVARAALLLPRWACSALLPLLDRIFTLGQLDAMLLANRPDLVQALIDRGIRREQSDLDMLLHLSVLARSDGLLACLLRRGADPNATHGQPDTCLHRAAHLARLDPGAIPVLRRMCSHLLDYGADPHFSVHGKSSPMQLMDLMGVDLMGEYLARQRANVLAAAVPDVQAQPAARRL